MQLKVISFVVIILHCMDYTGCQQYSTSRHWQHKQISGVSSGCQQGGCLTCSDYNGCLSCKPRFFMHLERIGMKQIGVCMTSCPPGFYGTRSRERNTCTKCSPECESCFNKKFCMRCRTGFYLHRGDCRESCPDDMLRSDTKRECVPIAECPAECQFCANGGDACARCRPGLYQLNGSCHRVCPDDYQANDKVMECAPRVHCQVSAWSEWSPCSRSGRTCGFKRGRETRARQVLRYPSPFGRPCPEISEIKDCLVVRRTCPGRRPNDRKQRRNRNKNKEVRREKKRERESAGDAGERQEDRNKTEHRRRRGRDPDPFSPGEGLVQSLAS
ncbi:R-spondin-3 isoform X2 [Syngnathus acus]|uniref:R-spondin-3 isoform X2 n=1 Tax=Syngnathus acus TaxID=161584 RepID=UPI001885E20F|nr:R-spondin-3 isoform X2 [Syngnathus acus]